MTRPRHLLIWTLALAAALAACGSDAETVTVAGPGELVHAHDLAVDENGRVLVASHTGLFRVDSVDEAVLVGTDRHDLMAMTRDGAELLASGHPDLRNDDYLVEGLPPHFGLARSDDWGVSWSVEDELLGHLDFHSLATHGEVVHAGSADGRIFRRDADGTWTELGSLGTLDLAVSPDGAMLVATDFDGTMWTSDDDGATWDPVDGAPRVSQLEWRSDAMVVAGSPTGEIWTAATPAGPWTPAATAPIGIEALHVDGDRWIVAGPGGDIRSTSDGGASWQREYQPPA